MKKQREYTTKFDSVLAGTTAELKARGLYKDNDLHLIQTYAQELAWAHILTIKIMLLPDSREDTYIRLTRTRKAHIQNANSLARTLRLAPLGRTLSNKAEQPPDQKADSNTFDIMDLAKKPR